MHISWDGRFEAVAPHIEAEAECVDLGGQLVIPPYVEPHIHLDAVYAGGRNGTGTFFEGIRRWSEVKASYPRHPHLPDDVVRGDRPRARPHHDERRAHAAHRRHLRLAPGKDASFLVLDAPLPFEAIRQRAGVLRSVRRGEELFTRVPAQMRSRHDLLA